MASGSFATLIATLLATSALHGCGGTPRDATDAEQTDYLLESATNAPYLSGLGMHLYLGSNRLAFTASCNHYSAPYSISGNRLVLGDAASTKMACKKEAEDKDRWLLAFLRTGPALTREGATVSLSDGKIMLKFVDRALAAPDKPLVGSAWRVRSYIDASGSTGMLGIEDPQLSFAANGTWTVKTACSVGKGHHLREEDRLVLSQTVYGPASCKNDNERASDNFVRALLQDGELQVKVQAKMLELRGGDHAIAAWTD